MTPAGGQSIGPDIGVGDVARFHSADEVKKILVLLSALDPVELRKRHDAVTMASTGIDPTDRAAWKGTIVRARSKSCLPPSKTCAGSSRVPPPMEKRWFSYGARGVFVHCPNAGRDQDGSSISG